MAEQQQTTISSQAQAAKSSEEPETRNSQQTENSKVSETIKEHLQGVFTEKDWDDIHCLSPEVIWKVKQTFQKPSLIQYMSIGETIEFIQPVITVKCRNGGGKTLAFGVPAIEFAFRNKDRYTQNIMQQSKSDSQTNQNKNVSFYCPTSIILVSTIPLAEQISSVLSSISPEGVTNEVLISEQKEKIKSTGQILISTPHLLHTHLLREKTIQLDNLVHFAVDEADNMISAFSNLLTDIITLFRGKDVIMQLISATLSPINLQVILNIYNPSKDILVEQQTLYSIELPWKLKGVTQYFYESDGDLDKKFETCKALVDRVLDYNRKDPKHSSQIIIFFEKIASIVRFEELLQDKKITNWKITSCSNRKERNMNIHSFRVGNFVIMLASKVMSRGIDIRKVGLVINYEVPIDFSTKQFDYNTYLHNIGRTGRYADQGVAVTFIDKNISLKTIQDSIKNNLESEILPYNIEKTMEELERIMQENNKIEEIEEFKEDVEPVSENKKN